MLSTEKRKKKSADDLEERKQEADEVEEKKVSKPALEEEKKKDRNKTSNDALVEKEKERKKKKSADHVASEKKSKDKSNKKKEDEEKEDEIEEKKQSDDDDKEVEEVKKTASKSPRSARDKAQDDGEKKKKKKTPREDAPSSKDEGKSPRDKGKDKEGDKKANDQDKDTKSPRGGKPKTPRGGKEEKSPRGGDKGKSPRGEKPKSPRKKGEESEDEEQAEETREKRVKGVLRAGRLYLVVAEARNLLSKYMFGKGSDPYCEIQFFDDSSKKKKEQTKTVYKSKVLKGELDPNWNEGSKIFPVKQTDREVRVMLWSANKLRSDDFMGQVVFQLAEINDGVPVDDWFELQSRKKKKDKVGGEIKIQALFLDDEDTMMGEEFSNPLQCFLKKRKLDIVEEMIKEKGMDIEHKDGAGYRPIHVAAQVNLPMVVDLLAEKGAKLNAKGGKKRETPLHVACAHSTESAVLLIKHGAKVDAQDVDGNLPIHIAAINDQPKSIEALLDAGTSINATNKEGHTPLHLAVQAKSFLALRKLVEKGADIYATDEKGQTVGEAAAGMDAETMEIFMKAIGVEDYLEVAVLREWKHRIRVEADGLSYEWQKSPQFAISAKENTECMILVHHVDRPDNAGIGYCVLSGNAIGGHKEPSLTELIGHGGAAPFRAEITPRTKTIVVPYAKNKDQPDRISLLVFTREEGDVEVTQLRDWECSVSVAGQWKGKSAGGCQNERKTWHRNPFFSLIIPKQPDVELCIVLAQKKNAMEEIIPYQILPYDFHIGFYLYDADVETKIGQVTKWKNAREVMQDFKLDGTVQRQYTIIPTTFQAKQETTFTLTVYSDEKKVVLKEFES